MKSRNINAAQFEALLKRLGPDRDQAGLRYEQLRRRLISLFTYRGCVSPEELADETLDRVARKLEELPTPTGEADPSPFVFGVAWNVARESFHFRPPHVLPAGCEPMEASGWSDESVSRERAQQCLDDCLQRLPVGDRNLVLAYFHSEKRAKIHQRALLAEQLRVSPNALRLRVHRITASLRVCVQDCAEQSEST